MFNRYTSFQRDTITFNPKVFNGKLEASVEFLDITELTQTIEEMNGKTDFISCGKKKEDEYIIQLQRLHKSLDKYHLINILKESQLYDDVKNVIIYHEKLENRNPTTKKTDVALKEEEEIGLFGLCSMFLSTKDLFRSISDCQIPSSTPDGTVTAFVLFNDPIDITTAIKNYDNQTRIIFDRVGTKLLQQILNETGTYIWWNYSSSFVRIYRSDQASEETRKRIDEYIRDTLNSRNSTIILDIPPGYIRQVLKMSATYRDKFAKEFNVEISTIVAERQVRVVEQQASSKLLTVATGVECQICYELPNYFLQACGHAFCSNCLKMQLSTKFDTTLTNQSLNIKCMISTCDSPLLLRDIKTIIDPKNIPRLARASLDAYLKTDKDIQQCMGTDCKQVYRKSQHPQSYFCDACLKTYCVKCKVEYHLGATCDQYQALLKLKPDDRLAAYNIGKPAFLEVEKNLFYFNIVIHSIYSNQRKSGTKTMHHM
ncbi:unnamed protein product [Rotaria magnacalcarata]|uniref:RBR-type E3 ubiquitin transferase n=2 Tax=Rotaria magnacalcarata TaxID=392030 RepID=A0A817AE23_9BILA|nr:unnamed protein product [Rotaria magnacalcarata]